MHWNGCRAHSARAPWLDWTGCTVWWGRAAEAHPSESPDLYSGYLSGVHLAVAAQSCGLVAIWRMEYDIFNTISIDNIDGNLHLFYSILYIIYSSL